MNQIKKGIGILSAMFTSAVLVLSLGGSGPPGCGGGGVDDTCEAACQNVLGCRNSSSSSGSSGSSGSYGAWTSSISSSSSGSSDLSECAQSCRRSLSSGSSSSSGDYNALVECIALAPSCQAIQLCLGGSGSSSGY